MKIELKKLGEGINDFAWTELSADFDLEALDLRSLTDIDVKLQLTKTGNTIWAKGEIHAWSRLNCSRCAEEFSQELYDSFYLAFHLGETTRKLSDMGSLDDDVEIISVDTQFLDFAARVHEGIVLAIPIKPLCSEECLGLCPMCGQNLNYGSCSCRSQMVDPRWEVLQNLKS